MKVRILLLLDKGAFKIVISSFLLSQLLGPW